MLKKNKWILFIFTLIIGLSACVPTRRFNGNPLIRKNVIEVHNGKAPKSDLYNYIQQDANQHFLGFIWIKSWLYEKLHVENPNRLRRWVINSFTQKPIYYQIKKAELSEKMMTDYLFSKGYFNAKVTHSVNEKDKATITYHVYPHQPYIVQSLDYFYQDTTIQPFIEKNKKATLIKKGQKYDAYLLDDERERISKALRNDGFFQFSKNFITYRVDSSLQDHHVKLYMDIAKNKITNPKTNKVEFVNHKQYKINKILIYPNYILSDNEVFTDTITLNYKRNRTLEKNTLLNFIYNRKRRVKPNTYARKITFSNNELYKQDEVQKTYNGLGDINIIRFVSIDFEEDTLKSKNSDFTYLNSIIRLHKRQVHSASIETEGTYSIGYPGITTRLVYENRNLFRGGEVFNLSLSGAVESKNKKTVEIDENKLLFFNTVETGIQSQITFPKLLLPVKPEFFSKDYFPSTVINTSFNYQKRLDYLRYLLNFSLSYRWKQSKKISHILTPIDINSVKIYKDSAFDARLSQLNQKYREQYSDHLIPAIRYAFLLNTQKINRKADFWYLRITLESSGALFQQLNQHFNFGERKENYGTLFNIRFAQYVRASFDTRFYKYFNHKTILATRLVTGLGIPYGNSNILPFEKAFFSGGANGLRGWDLREIGPGGYNDTEGLRFDRVGDLIIELNTEYRFPIYSYLNGALFADIGNVWLLNESSDFPNGHFEFDDFYKELGIDAGIGFRFDFQFFVLRIDVAKPLRKPSLAEVNRWEPTQHIRFNDFKWNFGIGYPF